MSFTTRFALLFALVASLLCAPAQASDYEVGTSLVCDTQAQVEHFVALFTGDAQATIRVVKSRRPSNSCAMTSLRQKFEILIPPFPS
jgi:hypothetical protein